VDVSLALLVGAASCQLQASSNTLMALLLLLFVALQVTTLHWAAR
jgi:hypothetical protein